MAFYDGELSSAVSFEPAATEDADRFARDGVEPRFAGRRSRMTTLPLVVIATDGELYGHHQPFREFFLERSSSRGSAAQRAVRADADRRPQFDVVALEEALVEPPGRPFRAGSDRGTDLVELPPRRPSLDGRMPDAPRTAAGRRR